MKIHWHFDNPWRDRAIYVPIKSVLPVADFYFQNYGLKLDAYILPSTKEESYEIGIRYGDKPDQYLAIGNTVRNVLSWPQLLSLWKQNELQWRPCRWADEKSWPQKDGFYHIRIAGDSETEGPHVYYEFPDYTTTARVKLDNGEGDMLINAAHDEEPETIIAWYGPIDVPECDCL